MHHPSLSRFPSFGTLSLAAIGALLCAVPAAAKAPPRTHLTLVVKATDGAGTPAKLWLAGEPPVDGESGAKGVKKTNEKKRPLILAFHQAGASSAEYLPIAPRLVALGFDVLAIDQRVGGNKFGGVNAYAKTFAATYRSTAPKKKARKKARPPYLAALPDMYGAVRWAHAQGYDDVILWGSSYSSALALVVAANTPGLRAVLSFSPGEYFAKERVRAGNGAKEIVGNPTLIQQHAQVIREMARGPKVLVITPTKEKKRAAPIARALGPMSAFLTPAGAMHGSSMLVQARCASAPTIWPLVERFLREALVD